MGSDVFSLVFSGVCDTTTSALSDVAGATEATAATEEGTDTATALLLQHRMPRTRGSFTDPETS